MSFKAEQVARLAESGWARCESVREALDRAGLPPVTPDWLASAFGHDLWDAAERAVRALRDHFASARFAEQTTYGILLVPDPGRLDTRRAMPAAVRACQLDAPAADVFDARLPSGVLGVRPGRPWTAVATVTGIHGPSLGSHNQIVTGPASAFTVAGTDTRALMIRQLWGARVLQNGSQPPDCEANAPWTFTLLPGEGLTDGQAESGTVLKGRVRFRLGKPDRGIGSARAAPAIAFAAQP
jgi:hypothetical protein